MNKVLGEILARALTSFRTIVFGSIAAFLLVSCSQLDKVTGNETSSANPDGSTEEVLTQSSECQELAVLDAGIKMGGSSQEMYDMYYAAAEVLDSVNWGYQAIGIRNLADSGIFLGSPPAIQAYFDMYCGSSKTQLPPSGSGSPVGVPSSDTLDLNCQAYVFKPEREQPYELCDENPTIAKIQTLLGIDPTGQFDNVLSDAVLVVQQDNGLDVNGTIDIALLDLLANNFGNGAGSSPCNFNITRDQLPWKKCDYSQGILDFQDFLNIDADGFFGQGTLKAIKAFQRINGLQVNGVIDQPTWDLYLQQNGS